MALGRAPGRYNLHRLGWSAFEDLCMQILRVILGETCSRFTPGADGGRDGWFQGITKGALASQGVRGSFVVQCKHTSSTHASLSHADLRREIEKIRVIARKGRINYVLMTNRQVSAQPQTSKRFAPRSAA